MGMCTYLIGFKPKDNKFNAMKLVYEACEHAKIPPPKEVVDFFEGYNPDDSGVRVDNFPEGAMCKWNDNNGSEGIEVNLDKLPSDIRILRFVNSW